MAADGTRPRLVPQDAQGDLAHPDQVDRNLDAILSRPTGQKLERICPEAPVLAATMTAALHRQIVGRATDLAGHREPHYRRDQLRAVKPMTDEDEAQLALQAPADLIPYLLPLLLTIAEGAPAQLAAALQRVAPLTGNVLVPLEGRMQDRCAAAGELGEGLGRASMAVFAALKDRQIDDGEREQLVREVLPSLKREIAAAEASLQPTPQADGDGGGR